MIWRFRRQWRIYKPMIVKIVAWFYLRFGPGAYTRFKEYRRMKRYGIPMITTRFWQDIQDRADQKHKERCCIKARGRHEWEQSETLVLLRCKQCGTEWEPLKSR